MRYAKGGAGESSIRKQLREHQDELNEMNPVANVSGKSYKGSSIEATRREIVDYIKHNSGFVVDVPKFGKVVIDEKRINNSLSYLGSEADAIAYKAIAPVLKRGKIISDRKKHKGREYGTVTFAAPVFINGTRGNMAVVVKQTSKNFYKMHRVLTTEGGTLDIKNNTEPTSGGGVTENGSLATPIGSASDNSIAQAGEEGKKNFAKSSRDAAYMSAVEEGNMEEAQRLVDEAAKEWGAITDEYGRVKSFYHSTSSNFTRFKYGSGMLGDGIYFTPYNQQLYGGRVVRAYLKYENPIEFRDIPREGRDVNLAGIPVNVKKDFYKLFPQYDALTSRDDELTVKSSSQIKSADPVTYDDDGNVIPLSERFSESDVIRYAKGKRRKAKFKEGDTVFFRRKEATVMKVNDRGLFKNDPIEYYLHFTDGHNLYAREDEIATSPGPLFSVGDKVKVGRRDIVYDYDVAIGVKNGDGLSEKTIVQKTVA